MREIAMIGLDDTRVKTKLKGVILMAVLILVVVTACQGTGEVKSTPIDSTPDLSDHPIYSSHDFGDEEETVIGVEIQPLWLPTGIIAEAMRRDAVLSEALSEQGLEIRFYPFPKGADVNFYPHRGDLEAAMGGDMPALTACATSDVLVTALIQQGFSSIVAQPHYLVEDWAGLALVAVRQGDLETAGAYADQLLAAWADNPTFEGADHPMRAFHFTWQVCQALGLAQADDVLGAAAQVMQTYLDNHPDPAAQAVYLQQPHHQPLWAAWQEREAI